MKTQTTELEQSLMDFKEWAEERGDVSDSLQPLVGNPLENKTWKGISGNIFFSGRSDGKSIHLTPKGGKPCVCSVAMMKRQIEQGRITCISNVKPELPGRNRMAYFCATYRVSSRFWLGVILLILFGCCFSEKSNLCLNLKFGFFQ